MFTGTEQHVIDWLQARKVATMRELRDRLQLSHMTVFRALKKYGYFHSYNHNAAYYVLHDVPRFDDGGLWTYRGVRFSRYGSLLQTLIALVETAPAGCMVGELCQRLQIPVANLLSRLVQQGRLQSQTLRGRQVVYLDADPRSAAGQQVQRQKLLAAADAEPDPLPPGWTAIDVIEVLRQKIVSPRETPERLARQLQDRGLHVTASQVCQVLQHYTLGKKRRSSR